jgi:hypothetical protein
MAVDIAFEQLDRTCVEIEPAIGKGKSKPNLGVFCLIDQITAEHQEMDTNRKSVEPNQEMLAPAFEPQHFLMRQPIQIDFGIARHFKDFFSCKMLDLLFEDDNGWTFGHGFGYYP